MERDTMPLLLERSTAVRVAAQLGASESLAAGGSGYTGDLLSPFAGFDAQLECLLGLLGSKSTSNVSDASALMGKTQLRQRALNARTGGRRVEQSSSRCLFSN